MSGNHDDGIDTVLQALRNAKPASGMQDRVLASLRLADATQNTSKSVHRWPRRITESNATLPWLTAAALLLVLGGTALLQKRGSTVQTSAATHTASALVGHAAAGHAEDPTLRPSKSMNPAGEPPTAAFRHVAQGQLRIHAGTPALRRSASADASKERSVLAPELPLTEQERLLLQLVRHEAPRQLAQLSKPALDAAFELERDGVAEFFAPPPPLRGQQEPLSSSTQAGQQ